MEKINIAELLKDCPKGMELDCTMFENTQFINVEEDDKPICIRTEDIYRYLTKFGTWTFDENAKCVIFPKGKTSWEGFQKPFEDGDIVTCKDRDSLIAFIYKERKNVSVVKYHFALYIGGVGTFTDGEICLFESELVFATEEEKAELFGAIKANGYKWNAETKTLEKLVEPQFRVGDRITNGKTSITIGYIDNEYYYEISRNIATRLFIKFQDEWSLVPNKFDINTLVPFESRVLMRSSNAREWVATFYSHYSNNKFYGCGMCCDQCIPYEGNEHLLGKTDDCDEYFKTWK